MTAKDGGMPRALRALILLLVVAVAVYVLFFHVFPWVDQKLNDPRLEAGAAAQAR